MSTRLKDIQNCTTANSLQFNKRTTAPGEYLITSPSYLAATGADAVRSHTFTQVY